ncbi:pentatricopeptide repeat-containing protein 2, mitochondrial-like [Lutzomyia longipalpis]|nr:pentatricopeptide repeat-containing protein 2, mitochondrial-like [Lutzomyia longipalpis]
MFRIKSKSPWFLRYSSGGPYKYTNGFSQCLNIHNRTLYAISTLGVDSFKMVQEKINFQFVNMTEKFRNKMQQISSPSTSNIIFTEDFKNMIHLAHNTPEDINLVKTLLMKFNRQSKEVPFGNYVFGPVLMRMFYCMGNIEVPLELFKNPELEGFFHQAISYQILMDMLYERTQYQEILKLYDSCKNESLKDQRHLIVLVMAACYRINSNESFNYAIDLWSQLTREGKILMRKASTFAAGLALRQNDPEMALKIISTIRQQSYMTVRNIRILASARLNRFEWLSVNLKEIMEFGKQCETNKPSISEDVLSEVLTSLHKNCNKELNNEIHRLSKMLQDHGHVTDKSLNELLTMQISATSFNASRVNQNNVLAGSFKSSTSRSVIPRFVHPGLAELK